jgi:DNA-binding CsgD family transcriptional regulator
VANAFQNILKNIHSKVSRSWRKKLRLGFSILNLWLGYKKPTTYRIITRFEEQQNVERTKCGRSRKSYRELGRKIQIHHNTVKKYLTKMGIQIRKIRTVRQQSVIKGKARLKLLAQIFFSVKSIYKCVMDDESNLTVKGDEYVNSKVIITLKITHQ